MRKTYSLPLTTVAGG